MRHDEHRDAMDFDAFRASVGVEIDINRKFNTVGKNSECLSKNAEYDP